MASTRFRVSQFIEPLRARGIEMELLSWLDDDLAATFYDGKGWGRKAQRMLSCTTSMLRDVLRRSDYDVLMVHREAALVGPPLLELLASRAGRVPIVFDIDDATWVALGPWLRDLARLPWKASALVRVAQEVVVGSQFLAGWARNRAKNVTVIPTVVPAAVWTPRCCRIEGRFAGDVPVVGWIGSHSTAVTLLRVLPALRRLRTEGYTFCFRVIGAASSFDLEGFSAERIPWREDLEMDMFRDIDIGLAPMLDGPFQHGKCAFKQIQYMTVGVPHVSSWVGGARDFVKHDVNGLVARDEEGWYRSIRCLLEDESLRARLSVEGRKLVEQELSAEVMVERMADVLLRAKRGFVHGCCR